MDLSKELRELYDKNVYIDMSHEYYGDGGANCNFSIIFRNYLYKKKDKCYQTGRYGDNHEFGDTSNCLRAAVFMANKLLTDDKLELYFEGNYMDNRDYRKEFDEFIFSLYKD